MTKTLHKSCPVQKFTQMLGGKWKLNILYALRKNAPLRFGKLHLVIEGISRKVLTEQLRELEQDGLVTRVQYSEKPPRVEYSMTQRAKELCSVFGAIEEWVDQN